jgi:rod shape-determining protein MreD
VAVVGRVSFCVLVLAVALIAEVTLLTRLPLPGGTPDLVLLAVVAFALAYGRLPGASIGFLAGLAVDLAPPAVTVVGREALVLCLVGYAAGAARELKHSLPVALALVAAVSAGALFLFAALGEVVGDGLVNWPTVLDLAPLTVAYDVALTPVLVLGILAVARRFDGETLPRRLR